MADAARPEAPGGESYSGTWRLMALMAAASGMPLMENAAVNVALPTIQRDLFIPSVTVQWVMVAYVLAASVLVAAGGRLGDLYGHRRLFLLGLAVSTFGAFVASFSFAPWVLVCGRAVEGAGDALTWPSLVAIVVTAVGRHRQGRALGTVASFGGLGLVVGPLVVEDVGWRLIFFLNGVTMAVVICLSLRVVPPSRRLPSPNLDKAGLVTFAAGTFALVLVLMQRRQWPFSSAPALLLLSCGASLLVAFVLIERRKVDPLIHLGLMRQRMVQGATGVGICVPFVTIAVAMYAAIYLQKNFGYSPLKAGMFLLPSVVMRLLVARLGGGLADRMGTRLPVVLGCGIAAASLCCLAFTDVWRDHAPFLTALGVLGIGVGIAETPARSAAQAALDRKNQGLAAGLFSTSNRLGQTLGAALVGFLLLFLQDQRAQQLLGPRLFRFNATDSSLVDEFLVKARIGLPGLKRLYGAHTEQKLSHLAHECFTFGFTGAMLFAAAVAFVGLVIGAAFLGPEPSRKAVRVRDRLRDVAARQPAGLDL